MPTVPRLEGQRVQQSAGPTALGQITARASQETFGQGEALNPVLDAGQKLFLQAKNNMDQVRVLEADQKLSALETKLLYDPEAGALSKRGKDAFESVNATNEQLDSSISEIEESLSNEQQKAAFRQRYAQRKESVNRQLNQHAAQEFQRYDQGQTEAFIKNEANRAIANPYDADTVSGVLRSQQAALYEYGKRNGMSDEQIKQSITASTSQTHSSVLSRMMADGNDIGAEEYFKQHSETFFGEDRIRAEKMVEEGSTLGKAMRGADDIFQKTGSLTQAMAQAKEIENPRIRQATESRLQHLFQQKKQAQNDFEEKVNIQATNFIDGGGTWMDYAKKNPSQWASLPSANKNAIMGYRAGGAEKTDLQTWYSLKELAANPDTRQKFIEMDLYKYKSQLSAGDFKELADAQFASRKGNTKGLDGFQSDSAIVNASLKQMGYSDTKIKDNSDEGVVAFRTKVDEWIINYKDTHGGAQPNNNDLRKAISSLSYEAVTQEGLLWNTKKRFFQMTDAEMSKLKTKDIPQDTLTAIRDTLRRNNRPATEQAVMDLFIKKLRKDTGRKVSAN